MSKRSQKSSKIDAKNTGNNYKEIIGPKKSHQALMLEQRIMFDAAAVASFADANTQHHEQPVSAKDVNGLADAAVSHVLPASAPNPVDIKSVAPAGGDTSKNEIVFVESDLAGLDALLAGIDSSKQVYILDANRDGIQQINEILAGQHDVDAIHILSHGSVGEITLGTSVLNESTLRDNATFQQRIGDSLKPDGDILIYGCNVAKGEAGATWLEHLATFTGADIAASNDLTGDASKGGDWNLEQHTGQVDTRTLWDKSPLNYSGLLPQPNYSNADGYISEQFFTIYFDIALDTSHPPSLSAFEAQINGTDATISAVELNSADNSIKVTFASSTLLAGDIIDFVYTDPTAGNDVNAVQGLDGTDAASFSHSLVVAIGRPGPSAPPTPTLDSGSDSGTLGDHVTNDNTPTVNGTAEANATVKLYDTDGSTLLGTTKADGSGKWSLTSNTLSDGAHTLKVTQTNNLSQTSSLSNGLTLSIDTVASAPTALAVSAGSDSGTLGDGISNVGTPVITGKAEANASVKLYDTDGTTQVGSATADGSGKWSITTSNLVSGVHTLTAKQTDVAGNVSSASSGFSYTVDTIGPVGMALSTKSVQVASATNGSTVATLSSTDITAVTYGFAVGNGIIDADNGKFTISGTSLKAAQNLSAGSYHIYLSATDAAGNDAFQIFTFTVTNAPSVSSINLVDPQTVNTTATSVSYTVTFSESVTGVDASDFSLTAAGTASAKISSVTGSGATYTVSVDTLAGDGTLRLDLNSSGTGIKNGSSSDILTGFTSGQTYTLDHTAPNATSTPAMTAGTDTGISSSDAITKNTTPVFTGTGEANATVNLYDTDGTTLLGTTTADGSGKWSITSSTMSEGAHTLTVKQSDAAGNVSAASSSLAVVIDKTSPNAPATPTLSPGSDSGVSGDFLTNVSTPVITGTSEANAIIKLYDTDGTTLLGTTTADGSGKWSITSSTLVDGSHSLSVKQTDQAGNVSSASSALTIDIDSSVPSTAGTPALKSASDSSTLGDGITSVTTPTLIGTGTVGDTVTLYDTDGSTVLGTAVVDGSGNWSIDSSTLADGVHTVTVKQTNAAGTSSSASKGFALTIDSTTPSAPSTPAMTAGTDTGVSSSDAITKNATPVFTGTSEANATIKLYDTDGTTLIGTTSADGSGKWSITSSKLADGAHSLTVKQTDTAGNVSVASSSLAVTIDTATPTAPTSPTLSPGSDGGTLGDFLTNVSTPIITGTSEANAIVKLYDTDGSTLLGTTVADGSGVWSISSSALGDGSHSLTVKQTDVAGNVSSASSALTIDIDTFFQSKAGITISDTALKAGDAATVTITFLGEAVTGLTNADLTIVNGLLSDVSSVDGGFTWTATYTPTADVEDATNLITLDNSGVSDAAGNSGSGTTESDNFTIDTLRPTATVSLSDATFTAGETALLTITFSEAVTNFTNADITVQGGTLSAVSSADDGVTWTATFTPTPSTFRANNVISVTGSGLNDLAGNAANTVPSSANFVVDTNVAPVLADTTVVLGAAAEDAATPVGAVGSAVSSLVQSGDNFTDPDTGTVVGIAVTALDTSHGVWFYSTNNGATWQATGAVSGSNALLLDANSRLYFKPDANFNGALGGGVTFRAWDGTKGSAGEKYAVGSDVGGSNAFSVREQSASLTVTPVNDTPTTSTSVLEGVSGNEGVPVSIALPANLFSDIDQGDTLTLSAKLADGSNLPGWLNFDPVTGTLSGTPLAVDGKPFTVVVTATDSGGLTVTSSRTIVIIPAPLVTPVAPPIVVAPPTSAPVVTVDYGTPLSGGLAGAGLGARTGGSSGGLGDGGTPILNVVSSVGAGSPSLLSGGQSGGSGLGGGFGSSGGLSGGGFGGFAGGTNGGFSTPVDLSSRGAATGGVLVARPVADMTLGAGNASFTFSLPRDTFSTATSSALTFSAKQASGQPLPAWLHFDPVSQTFAGQPPPGFRGEIVIQVTARDAQGHQATAVFNMKAGTGATDIREQGQGSHGESQPGAGGPRPQTLLMPDDHWLKALQPGNEKHVRHHGGDLSLSSQLAQIPSGHDQGLTALIESLADMLGGNQRHVS